MHAYKKCMPMRCMPIRCTPVRCTSVRCTPEIHACKMHAYKRYTPMRCTPVSAYYCVGWHAVMCYDAPRVVPHSIAEVGCERKMAAECGCPETSRRAKPDLRFLFSAFREGRDRKTERTPETSPSPTSVTRPGNRHTVVPMLR